MALFFDEEMDMCDLNAVEIFFSDLKPEAQKRLLDSYGMTDPREGNWDVFPVFVLYPDTDEPKGFDV
jgi:hypothetical protein